MCQTMRVLLAGEEVSPNWSRRAQSQIEELRKDHSFVNANGTTLLSRPPSGAEWWTFAGTRCNATLAGVLSKMCNCRVGHDALAISVEGTEGLSEIENALRELASQDPLSMAPAIDEEALEGLKFSQCLPHDLGLAVLATRMKDVAAVKQYGP